MKTTQVFESMVNGEFMHDGGNWFGISISLKKDINWIVTQLDRYPELKRALNKLNLALLHANNAFEVTFTRVPNADKITNHLNTSLPHAIKCGETVSVNLCTESSRSFVTTVHPSEEGDSSNFEELTAMVGYVEGSFKQFIGRLNEFLEFVNTYVREY